MLEIFDQQNTQVSVFTPLDSLFSEYCKKKSDIERISDYVRNDTPVMSYFFEGAERHDRHFHISAAQLFDAAPAIRALDAEFWSRAMQLTDVLEAMDATKRNEWHTQIREHKTPAFESESVIATIRQLLAQRDHFFSQRVDGLFHNLSDSHITNTPQGFGRRFIINYMLGSYNSINSDRCNYIHDLRCVIAKFSGRDAPFGSATYHDLNNIVKDDAFGQWHSFDGGAVRLRLYRKGTAHMEVHPDMAIKLNQILAFLHPNAIPAEFRRTRTKEQRRAKEHVMEHDLISFKTLACLDNGRISNGGYRIWFSTTPVPSAIKVLEYIGGLHSGVNEWLFDYQLEPVLKALLRTGSLPERVSHQFYPTPRNIAQVAVDMADIGPEHTVLEPSAGQGGIANFLPKDRTTCVEISQFHCAVLKAKGYSTICRDFLDWNSIYTRGRAFAPETTFDRIVCNPPFSEGRAVLHVTRAAAMLSPNGVLVAVLPASFKDKTLVNGMDHQWSKVFTNEFENTSVSTIIVRLQRVAA